MASVWAGHHAESGLPVAVKLVHKLSDRLRAVFRREVEAVAALDHPGIIMVHDHGELEDGGLWLVMERASAGSLEETPLPRTWSEMLTRVLRILDALAHAHARGVVHRDLKPGNVLMCGTRDFRPGLKLADFGLALAMDGREVLVAGAGTPAYMAPEQVLGHWWDLGPWTDLYALGGMAWEMATGSRPFPGDDPKIVGRAQVSIPLPEFDPQIPVPAELEGLLRALLDKDPSQRPDSAAWCAAELLAMGPAEHLAGPRATPASGALPTMGLFTLVPGTAVSEDLDDLPSLTALDERLIRTPITGSTTAVVSTRHRLDPPADWHRAISVRPQGLTQAGLGLFGVRPTPFEGRVTECHRLWGLLRIVSRTRVPHVGLIEGSQGLGASRLAEWLGQRAAEVGAAKLLTVTHGSSDGALQGIPALAEQILRLRGVPEEFARPRAETLGILAEPMLALAAGHEVTDAIEVALRMVMHEAQAGPVVLWIDDAHRDEGMFRLIAAILDAGAMRELPVLVLATVDTDEVVERPAVERAIGTLVQRDQVQRFPLRPMKRSAMSRMLRRMLPFDPKVIPQIVEIANGSPMVAGQLIGGWLASGDLIATSDGYAPRRGATAPGDLREVWARRLEPFLSSWSRPERHAVLVAAVLGGEVALDEWTEACERLLIPVAEDAVADLTRAGLVRNARRKFRFTHGLIRQVLLSRAEDEGVRTEFEEAAAQVVPEEAGERVGRHLKNAGQFVRAFDHLTSAVEGRIDRDNYGAALWLVDQAEACLDAAGVSEDDERRGLVARLRIYTLASDWQLERCLSEGTAFLKRCDEHGWQEAGTAVLAYMGTAAFRLMRLDEAQVVFQRLIEGTEKGTLRRSRALRGLGQVYQARLEYEKAEDVYREYHEIALAHGDPFLIASSFNDLGSTATRLGRSDEALAYFKKGLDLCVKHDFKDKTVARLNVLGQLMKRGRHAEAHEQAMVCLDESEEQFSLFALACTHALLLQTSAANGDWATWDRVESRVRTLISAARLKDQSIAECALYAGDFCLDAREPERAAFAFRLAVEQYQAIKQPELAAEVERKLNAVRG